MASWNIFDIEVQAERQKVRNYGLNQVMDRCREPDTYKGQALRQLAMRLELEELVRSLRYDIGALVDNLERLELELRKAKNQCPPTTTT
jgi:hypothetical protein